MSALGTEARVGIFVLAAVAVLVTFLLALGDVRLAPSFNVNADFGFAGGLSAGSPVKMSGIRIGQVAELRIVAADASPAPAAPVAQLGRSSAAHVRARVALNTEARPLLRQDITFAVATQGLIGESYLELQPGDATSPPLSENAVVRGVDAPRMHVMFLQASSILDVVGGLLSAEGSDTGVVGQAIAQLLGTVNGVLVDRRTQLIDSISNIAAATADLRSIMAGVRVGIGQGDDLHGLVVDGRSTVEVLKRDLPGLLARGQGALTNLEVLTAKANDSVDGPALKDTLKDARAAAQHLEGLTADAQVVLKSIRRGEGTVGGLIQDPQLYDDIKELLRDLKTHPWKFLWRD